MASITAKGKPLRDAAGYDDVPQAVGFFGVFHRAHEPDTVLQTILTDGIDPRGNIARSVEAPKIRQFRAGNSFLARLIAVIEHTISLNESTRPTKTGKRDSWVASEAEEDESGLYPRRCI